jgi:hypothetical protein
LADAASEIIFGVNGGDESLHLASVIAPAKAKLVGHGLQSRCENPTIVLMEEWLKSTSEEACVLYFHAKGASHNLDTLYAKFEADWRECLMYHCVDHWRQCVADLALFEAVGCHWLTNWGADRSQNYFAGTFFWARASYLRTLPSIFLRDRIKISGIASLDSRYEAEVWIGNGPRLPTVRDYHSGRITNYYDPGIASRVPRGDDPLRGGWRGHSTQGNPNAQLALLPGNQQRV